MPSNRSKKDAFHKGADNTLKRQLISLEFIKHIALVITGKEAHNGADALLVTSSSKEYVDLENFYNEKLASYITSIRYKIAQKVKNRDYELPSCDELGQKYEGASSNASVDKKLFEVGKAKKYKVRNKEMKIIPASRFEDYWADRKLVVEDLKKYNKVSCLYKDINRRIIDDYSYSAISILRQAYGSCIPVIKYNIEHYETLLEIYEKHKDEYDLAYPSFPGEFLVRRIIPDNE